MVAYSRSRAGPAESGLARRNNEGDLGTRTRVGKYRSVCMSSYERNVFLSMKFSKETETQAFQIINDSLSGLDIDKSETD